MEIWEASDELRVATAQRRWAAEFTRDNPAIVERLRRQCLDWRANALCARCTGDERHEQAAA
jgi:hypothetical protein